VCTEETGRYHLPLSVTGENPRLLPTPFSRGSWDGGGGGSGHSWQEQSRREVCRGEMYKMFENVGLYPIFFGRRGAYISGNFFRQSRRSQDICQISHWRDRFNEGRGSTL
jgi:hypothetical protein